MKKFFLFLSITLLVPGIGAVIYGSVTAAADIAQLGYVFIASGAVFQIIAERYSKRTKFSPSRQDMVQLVIALPAFSALAYSIVTRI